MKIYTKFGDKGKTRLYGGEVVDKDHPRIEAYGTLDELNSIIGLAISSVEDSTISQILTQIQNDLFRISAILATPDQKTNEKLNQNVSTEDIGYLETQIDNLDEQMPVLQNFILPGGTESAAHLHLARTVCRRGERYLIKLFHHDNINPDIIVYINRLSDLLFVMARFMNHLKNVPDIPWKSE
jgi:cob(I)alamin adenosyltransferase